MVLLKGFMAPTWLTFFMSCCMVATVLADFNHQLELVRTTQFTLFVEHIHGTGEPTLERLEEWKPPVREESHALRCKVNVRRYNAPAEVWSALMEHYGEIDPLPLAQSASSGHLLKVTVPKCIPLVSKFGHEFHPLASESFESYGSWIPGEKEESLQRPFYLLQALDGRILGSLLDNGSPSHLTLFQSSIAVSLDVDGNYDVPAGPSISSLEEPKDQEIDHLVDEYCSFDVRAPLSCPLEASGCQTFHQRDETGIYDAPSFTVAADMICNGRLRGHVVTQRLKSPENLLHRPLNFEGQFPFAGEHSPVGGQEVYRADRIIWNAESKEVEYAQHLTLIGITGNPAKASEPVSPEYEHAHLEAVRPLFYLRTELTLTSASTFEDSVGPRVSLSQTSRRLLHSHDNDGNVAHHSMAFAPLHSLSSQYFASNKPPMQSPLNGLEVEEFLETSIACLNEPSTNQEDFTRIHKCIGKLMRAVAEDQEVLEIFLEAFQEGDHSSMFWLNEEGLPRAIGVLTHTTSTSVERVVVGLLNALQCLRRDSIASYIAIDCDSASFDALLMLASSLKPTSTAVFSTLQLVHDELAQNVMHAEAVLKDGAETLHKLALCLASAASLLPDDTSVKVEYMDRVVKEFETMLLQYNEAEAIEATFREEAWENWSRFDEKTKYKWLQTVQDWGSLNGVREAWYAQNPREQNEWLNMTLSAMARQLIRAYGDDSSIVDIPVLPGHDLRHVTDEQWNMLLDEPLHQIVLKVRALANLRNENLYLHHARKLSRHHKPELRLAVHHGLFAFPSHKAAELLIRTALNDQEHPGLRQTAVRVFQEWPTHLVPRNIIHFSMKHINDHASAGTSWGDCLSTCAFECEERSDQTCKAWCERRCRGGMELELACAAVLKHAFELPHSDELVELEAPHRHLSERMDFKLEKEVPDWVNDPLLGVDDSNELDFDYHEHGARRLFDLLSFLEQIFQYTRFQFRAGIDEGWGKTVGSGSMLSATAAIVLRNKLNIMVGLFGGFFNVEVYDFATLKLTIFGQDIKFFEAKVALIGGFNYKLPIPTNALMGLNKAFGNVVGKVKAIIGRVLGIMRTAENRLLSITSLIDRLLSPVEQGVETGYKVAAALDDVNGLKVRVLSMAREMTTSLVRNSTVYTTAVKLQETWETIQSFINEDFVKQLINRFLPQVNEMLDKVNHTKVRVFTVLDQVKSGIDLPINISLQVSDMVGRFKTFKTRFASVQSELEQISQGKSITDVIADNTGPIQELLGEFGDQVAPFKNVSRVAIQVLDGVKRLSSLVDVDTIADDPVNGLLQIGQAVLDALIQEAAEQLPPRVTALLQQNFGEETGSAFADVMTRVDANGGLEHLLRQGIDTIANFDLDLSSILADPFAELDFNPSRILDTLRSLIRPFLSALQSPVETLQSVLSDQAGLSLNSSSDFASMISDFAPLLFGQVSDSIGGGASSLESVLGERFGFLQQALSSQASDVSGAEELNPSQILEQMVDIGNFLSKELPLDFNGALEMLVRKAIEALQSALSQEWGAAVGRAVNLVTDLIPGLPQDTYQHIRRFADELLSQNTMASIVTMLESMVNMNSNSNTTGWQTCLLNISSSIQFDQLAVLKVAVSDAITSLETQLQSAEAASAAAIEQVLTQVSQLYEAVSMGEVGLAEAFNRVSAASSLPDMLSVVASEVDSIESLIYNITSRLSVVREVDLVVYLGNTAAANLHQLQAGIVQDVDAVLSCVGIADSAHAMLDLASQFLPELLSADSISDVGMQVVELLSPMVERLVKSTVVPMLREVLWENEVLQTILTEAQRLRGYFTALAGRGVRLAEELSSGVIRSGAEWAALLGVELDPAMEAALSQEVISHATLLGLRLQEAFSGLELAVRKVLNDVEALVSRVSGEFLNGGGVDVAKVVDLLLSVLGGEESAAVTGVGEGVKGLASALLSDARVLLRSLSEVVSAVVDSVGEVETRGNDALRKVLGVAELRMFLNRTQSLALPVDAVEGVGLVLDMMDVWESVVGLGGSVSRFVDDPRLLLDVEEVMAVVPEVRSVVAQLVSVFRNAKGVLSPASESPGASGLTTKLSLPGGVFKLVQDARVVVREVYTLLAENEVMLQEAESSGSATSTFMSSTQAFLASEASAAAGRVLQSLRMVVQACESSVCTSPSELLQAERWSLSSLEALEAAALNVTGELSAVFTALNRSEEVCMSWSINGVSDSACRMSSSVLGMLSADGQEAFLWVSQQASQVSNNLQSWEIGTRVRGILDFVEALHPLVSLPSHLANLAEDIVSFVQGDFAAAERVHYSTSHIWGLATHLLHSLGVNVASKLSTEILLGIEPWLGRVSRIPYELIEILQQYVISITGRLMNQQSEGVERLTVKELMAIASTSEACYL